MRDNRQKIIANNNKGTISANVHDNSSNSETGPVGGKETGNGPPVRKILILSANPDDTGRLRLDKEVREIEESLQRSEYRDRFRVHQKWAVNFWDIRRALTKYKPQILHFAGHGEKNGLRVEGELGMSVAIAERALAGLFELCSRYVECVVLNACYSESQVSVIRKHIDYVVGMKNEIKDNAALEFSVGFYDALGAGETIEDAFKYGRNAILQIYPDLPGHSIPVLKKGDGKP